MARERLEDRQDRGFLPPDDWTVDQLDRDEIRRLLFSAMMCHAAAWQSRRLRHVDRFKRAADKRIARRTANVYHVCLRFYGAGEGDWRAIREQSEQNEATRQAGAQVIWPEWIPTRINWLAQRAGHIATFALHEHEIEWGNMLVFRLDRERELLELIMESEAKWLRGDIEWLLKI